MPEEKKHVEGQPPKIKLDDRILQAIPLLAPVPTAWMIYDATTKLMHYPMPVAIASALTVEGLGFTSINLANEMREFNRHLNAVEIKQKMTAPVGQAYAVTGLYVGTATLMTVILHINPDLVVYAPLPFIVMAVAGGWIYALRKEHLERVAQRDAQRQQISLKRRSAKSSDAQRPSATLSDGQKVAQRRSATKPATLTAKIYRCECGWQSADRYKYSGHTRQCEIHKNKKLIPVSIHQTEKVQS